MKPHLGALGWCPVAVNAFPYASFGGSRILRRVVGQVQHSSMGGVGGCGQGRVAGKAGVSRGALGKSQKVYRVSGATPKSYRKSYRQIVSAGTLF